MSRHACVKAAFRKQVLSLYFDHPLKPSEKSVLMTLATFLGADGLYLSHDAIARACRYSVQTVIRALERGYELGLIERTHRRKQVEGRWVRTSNTYRLLIKATDQVRAAGKHMARAVFRGVLIVSDRMAQKASRDIHIEEKLLLSGRRYPEPHGPSQFSPGEWIEIIKGWETI
ncbi:hypothetical protein Gxy13693_080_008 [Komagataeibacter xylinus NBRC 13693]|uniref:Helix-turn-helix domain-containing protein n=1 Tax=Komagataeibacter xylinus NBRC 13693 TaxID=1234668 RepID=A0A0D6QC34_KOMXY|nr:hypothetical protein [Komagataeibacter xylinus]GAO00985.1 hypothetical protein Gxy13693_080_008 [Komagataeibacter xylinus NBRC 13693]